jgi:hypothetical protein
VPQSTLRSFNVRFSDVTRIGDAVTCSGRVVERVDSDGETRIRVAIHAADQAGNTRTVGEALIAWPPDPNKRPKRI